MFPLSTLECACTNPSRFLQLKNSTKKPSDYLASFPPLPKSSFQVLTALHLFCKLCSRLPDNICKVRARTRVQGHSVLQHELERVRAGKAMEPLDTSRFHLAPPTTNKQNDFAAWRQATDNAHSQLEHQYNRCGQATTTLFTSS